jgi:hypothetical protein
VAALFFSSATAWSNTSSLPQDVLPLSGSLDQIPVFNSNSPEVVKQPGILLSTFPAETSSLPGAHLGYPLTGRFDVFFHHIVNGIKTHDYRTLFIACLVGNASNRKVTVHTLKASSYLSQPDAPFQELPSVAPDNNGNIFAGPGDRVALDFLRGKTQKGWRSDLVLAPGEQRLLFCLPVTVSGLGDPLNGRSGLVQLKSNGPVYLATLALFGTDAQGHDDSPPSLADWQKVLADGILAGPRDVAPTAPDFKGGIKYGRVAGIDRGTSWTTTLANQDVHGPRPRLGIKSGETISYVISSVTRGTLGTEQVQSAPMLVRYPDTAYMAHGNYGVLYDLTLPIANTSTEDESVEISLESPIKNKSDSKQLTFYDDPPKSVFFRGAVRLRFRDEHGRKRDETIHLVEKQGQLVDPFISLSLRPGQLRTVRVSLVYPADATPPQVLTLTAKPARPHSDP